MIAKRCRPIWCAVTIVLAGAWAWPSWSIAQSASQPSVEELVETPGDAPDPQFAPDAFDALIVQPFAPKRKVQLSLIDCVAMTLRKGAAEGAFQLQLARLDPEIASMDIDTALADFDPTLSLSTLFTDYRNQSTTALAGAATSESHTNSFAASIAKRFQTGGTVTFGWQNVRSKTNSTFVDVNPNYDMDLILSLSQPLLRDAGVAVNTAQIHVAENTTERSRLDLINTQMDVIRQVHEAYWNLVFAIENLGVQRKSLALAESTLEDNRKREAVGRIPHLEVVGAEADVERRREEIHIAESAIAEASDTLRNLVNNPEDDLQHDVQIVPRDKAVLTEQKVNAFNAIRETLMYRPDLKQARLDVKNAGINIEVAKNALLPFLDLTLTYTRNGIRGHFSDSVKEMVNEGGTRDYDAQLTFTLPLGRRAERADFTRRELQKTRSILTLKNLERQAIIGVKDAVRDVWTSLASVRAAQQQRIFSEKNVISEQRRFEVGKKTSLDVLNAQEQLAEAERSEIQAIVNYNISLIVLEQEKGTILRRMRISFADADAYGDDEDL